MRIEAYIVSLLLMLASCQHQQPASTAATEKAEEEDTEAKAMMQGVWQEELTEEVVFRAEGDTIYYPDPSDQPAHFRVVSDSLEVGTHRYPIVKQTEHQLWFCNQSGDVTKLVKSEEADDTLAFVRQPAEMLMPKDVLKTDSVVNYEGQRYHWYVAVNPTRYRVTKTVYNGEGVAVDNVYYDNIIHISLYQGSKCLFSRDFKKSMYEGEVSPSFLEQAILGNMQYTLIDGHGVHFDATLCIPDEASCYLVETVIGFDGKLSLKLVE